MKQLSVLLIVLFLFGSSAQGTEYWADVIHQAEDTLWRAKDARDSLEDLIFQLETVLASFARSGAQGPRTNWALGRPAEQSSLSAWGGPPELAVDGNTDGRFSQGSVMHTSAESSPWWQVDLQAVRFIEEISLWNRVEDSARSTELHVFLSDTPFVGDTTARLRGEPGVTAYYIAEEIEQPTTIAVGRSARYVRVQMEETAGNHRYLHLAEVEVWGH